MPEKGAKARPSAAFSECLIRWSNQFGLRTSVILISEAKPSTMGNTILTKTRADSGDLLARGRGPMWIQARRREFYRQLTVSTGLERDSRVLKLEA
jgi:hypothetical protein